VGLHLALNICKRLFFDYQNFYEANEWGNPDILLDAIHFIENHTTEKPDYKVIAAIIQKVEDVTPDTEDFGEANYALNACCAVCSTLEFLLDKKGSHITNVGTNLIDTIDAKVQGDDYLTEEEIDQHPLMVDTRTFLLEETK
jgi:uncharacterized protein